MLRSICAVFTSEWKWLYLHSCYFNNYLCTILRDTSLLLPFSWDICVLYDLKIKFLHIEVFFRVSERCILTFDILKQCNFFGGAKILSVSSSFFGFSFPLYLMVETITCVIRHKNTNVSASSFSPLVLFINLFLLSEISNSTTQGKHRSA